MSWLPSVEADELRAKARRRYEIRGRNFVVQLVDDEAAEGPGRSSDGDGHVSFSYVSFCVQASPETVTVTDQAKKIKLWPVLAPSRAGLHCCPLSDFAPFHDLQIQHKDRVDDRDDEQGHQCCER